MKHGVKRQAAWLIAAVLALLSGAARAQTTPSNACFSPGLTRVAQAVGAGEAVSVQAEFGVEDAFYARDLYVLDQMLSGTSIRYDGGTDGKETTDVLTVTRQGEPLFCAALTSGEAGARLSLGTDVYDVSGLAREMDAGAGAWLARAAELDGAAILERVPLAQIDAWLSGLSVGAAVLPGVTVQAPFSIERTMSDDGARLTRLDIEGAVLLADGETWTVSGFLRQPGGKAPKDTFELTLTRDADNYIELTYSALRENEVERRDRQGVTRVNTALNADGRVGGYGVSARLTVRMRNEWTADDAQLSEKITVSTAFSYRDRTPGRRMQRLNSVDVDGKNVIRVKTDEAQGDVLTFTDEATLSVTMDDNVFLSGSMALRADVGGQAPEPVADAGLGEEALSGALAQAVQTLSQKLYAQLGDTPRGKITEGLDTNP